jgi:hypothetical protein
MAYTIASCVRSWAEWYKILVGFWIILGLPGAVIGYGMSGGDIEVPTDPVAFMVWLPCAFFIVSPFVLWPWRKFERRS